MITPEELGFVEREKVIKGLGKHKEYFLDYSNRVFKPSFNYQDQPEHHIHKGYSLSLEIRNSIVILYRIWSHWETGGVPHRIYLFNINPSSTRSEWFDLLTKAFNDDGKYVSKLRTDKIDKIL